MPKIQSPYVMVRGSKSGQELRFDARTRTVTIWDLSGPLQTQDIKVDRESLVEFATGILDLMRRKREKSKRV